MPICRTKTSHLHVHILPRYSAPRMVNGFEFVDENWGRMFYPYDETISLPEDVLQEIIRNIRSQL